MNGEPYMPLPPEQDLSVRPEDCPDCGSNEWEPVFRKSNRTLIGWSCGNCWTFISKNGDLVERSD